jgi:exosome complex component RRP42
MDDVRPSSVGGKMCVCMTCHQSNTFLEPSLELQTSTMAPSSTLLLSRSEETYIRSGCRDDCRTDGRTQMDFRSYTIVVGSKTELAPPLILSNGSARLVSSDQQTHLLCSIKAEVVRPAINTPNEGVVEFHVDRLTTASSATRRTDDELQALCQTLLVDQLLDKKALCISPGEYAWKLAIDLYIISSSGSLLDAASHVISAALQNTLLPSVDPLSPEDQESKQKSKNSIDLVVDGDIHAAQPPPGTELAPILTTITVLKCPSVNSLPKFVLIHDATAQEEACAYCQVHVAVDTTNVLCGLQTLGTGSLPLSLLPEITAAAIQSAQQSKLAYKVVQSKADLLQEPFAMQ